MPAKKPDPESEVSVVLGFDQIVRAAILSGLQQHSDSSGKLHGSAEEAADSVMEGLLRLQRRLNNLLRD